MKTLNLVDPTSYIQEQLNDLKLTPEQKEIIQESLTNESTYKDNMKKLFSNIKANQAEKDPRLLKKLENIAPLYDAHDFWDSQPVPKAYETVDEKMWDQQIDVLKTPEMVR